MRSRSAYVYFEIKFLQRKPGFPEILYPRFLPRFSCLTDYIAHNLELIEKEKQLGASYEGTRHCTMNANLNRVVVDNMLLLILDVEAIDRRVNTNFHSAVCRQIIN